MGKSRTQKKVEQFIEHIERIVNVKDDLIYGTETSVRRTMFGDRKVWLEITFYNVDKLGNALPPQDWMRFGKIDAEVHTHRGVNPSIEFYKTIER